MADVAKSLGILNQSLFKLRYEVTDHSKLNKSDVKALRLEVIRLNATLEQATDAQNPIFYI